MFILFFTGQKKEPEPTQKIGFGSSSSFKSAPAPRKNLGSDSATLFKSNSFFNRSRSRNLFGAEAGNEKIGGSGNPTNVKSQN